MEKTGALKLRISTLISWAAMLVMAQLLITQWSVEAAGNREVIDYVSFAGTVVGMILAILAIVYSYLSNASQRSDAEALRIQISNLNDAIGKAQVSGSQFTSEVNRLEEIRETIAQTAANSAAALEASGRVEAELKSLRGDVSKRPGDKTVARTTDADYRAVIELLPREALPRQVVLYYLAATDDDHGISDLKAELLSILTATSKSPVRKTWFEGEIRGYYWVFYDLGIISNKRKRRIFFESLSSKIESLPKSEQWETEKQAIKDCITIVKSHLETMSSRNANPTSSGSD